MVDESKVSSIVGGWATSNQLKGLRRNKNGTLPRVRKDSPADCLWAGMVPLVLTPASPHCKFGLASLHMHMSQVLITNLVQFMYTFYWFCFSGEPD